MISDNEFAFRTLALAVGLTVTLRATRHPARRGRSFWRVLGVVTALTPCVLTLGKERRSPYDWQQVALIAGAISSGLIPGALALVVGLRGRRVGDHEHCRRCGFDLFGRPAESRVCPECGAPLDADRATVVGVEHRRPVPLLTGCFALLLGLAVIGAIGRDVVASLQNYNWRPWWPERWLVADLKSPWRASRELAITTS